MKRNVCMIACMILGVLFFFYIDGFSADASNKQKKWFQRMANSEMQRFPEAWQVDFTEKPKWNYAQGLVCQSFLEVWKATGKIKYFNYAKGYADALIDNDGGINTYSLSIYSLDNINAGKILFDLYRETKSEKYRIAIMTLREQMRTHPRTLEGGFWHKKRYPHQMWLDGLYMCAPFLAQYAKEFKEPELYDEAVKQISLIAKHTKDEKTGLFYHGWDESRTEAWADPVTGTSPSFWSRGIGWYAMSIVDVLDFLPKKHLGRKSLINILQDLAQALTVCQDKRTGLWYQVTDQVEREGNYLESSGSSMFVYALAKAAKNGYIDEKYLIVARKGYKGLIRNLIRVDKDGMVNIIHCCRVAGLGGDPYRSGTYEYYINEEVIENDPKSVGSFILASIILNK